MESVENDIVYLLPVLNRFGEAIEILSHELDIRPDDVQARLSRAMLLSRTKQFEEAEKDIQLLSGDSHFVFVSFYHRYFQDRMEDAQKHFESILRNEELPLRFRFWSCAMMGQAEQAIAFMESSAERGAPIFNIRVLLNNAVTRNRVAEVEAHPRYQRFLERFDIDPDWCSELSGLVNDVTGITGIHVDS